MNATTMSAVPSLRAAMPVVPRIAEAQVLWPLPTPTAAAPLSVIHQAPQEYPNWGTQCGGLDGDENLKIFGCSIPLLCSFRVSTYPDTRQRRRRGNENPKPRTRVSSVSAHSSSRQILTRLKVQGQIEDLVQAGAGRNWPDGLTAGLSSTFAIVWGREGQWRLV